MISGSDGPGYSFLNVSVGRPPDEAPKAAAGPEEAPKTSDGAAPSTGAYDESRWNSSREGLRSRILLPAELRRRADELTAAFTRKFQPTDEYEKFLIREMALATAKSEYSDELMLVDFERRVDRAIGYWQFDRARHARELGRQYARDPRRVCTELLKTPQGVAVVIDFWKQLDDILKTTGTWDAGQRRMAFDLLAVPQVLRENSLRIPADADTQALAEVVAREVGRLRAEYTELLKLDAADQGLAEIGHPMMEDAAAKRVKRGAAEARRDFKRARDELLRVRAGATPNERLIAQSMTDMIAQKRAAAATPEPAAAPPRAPARGPATAAAPAPAIADRPEPPSLTDALSEMPPGMSIVEYLAGKLNQKLTSATPPAAPAAPNNPPSSHAERKQSARQGRPSRKRRGRKHS
jgi:hypothetical protein